AAVIGARHFYWRLLDLALAQLAEDIRNHCHAEAGSDLAGIAQVAALVDRQEQGAQRARLAVARAPADDDELLALHAFDLQPVPAAAADIRSIGALGDDAFLAGLAHGIEQFLALPDDMIGVEDQRRIAVADQRSEL